MISKKSLLGISIGAILAVSLFAFSGNAIADDDENGKFKGKPDFVADLVRNTGNSDTDGFDGQAKFWITKNGKFLKYRIHLDGPDISGFTGFMNGGTDDVTKTHLHRGSIFGPHVLNIYKAPTQDDNDLVIRPNQGIIKGIWDDGDLSPVGLAAGPASEKLTDNLDNLCDEDVWLVVHTNTADSTTQFDPVSNTNKALGDRALWGNVEKTNWNNFCDYDNDDNDDDDDDE